MISALTAYRTLDDSRHRAEFYRMWRAGVRSSFTHGKTFESMGHSQSPLVEDARQWLLAGTTKGGDVAGLVRGGGARFEEMERALVPLGEESGKLEEMLRLLADYFTSKHRLMLWVKKQLAYPLMTGLAACFIAPFPLLFAGHTRAYVIVAFSGAAALVLGAGGIVLAASRAYGRRPHLARARLARGLATAVEAGLPLAPALRLAADASANAEIRHFVNSQGERQLSGQSIVASLSGCPHLTPDFMAIIETAERTGDFSVVTRLAQLYEDGFR